MMERKQGANIAAVLRTAFVAVLIVVQLAFMIAVVYFLGEYSVAVYSLIDFAALVLALILLGDNQDSAFKTAWLIIVLIVPILGILLYLAWGRGATSSRERKYRQQAFARAQREMPSNRAELEALTRHYPGQARTARYLSNYGFPVYRNTRTAYYPLGELFFDALIKDIEKAQRYVFLEYFIVAPGQVWSRIYQALCAKAAQGVDVRLLYDDGGCLMLLNGKFNRELQSKGIKVSVFAPVHRYVSELYLNYRNHQKIAVIDGEIGYVGGANIADEYANLYEKHGHWKDTCLRMEGEGVWSLATTFISMWDLSRHDVTEDYDAFRPKREFPPADSFAQPFSDGPTNNPDNPAGDTYRQMLSNASDYCYITTPYLVVNDAMLDALRMAAHSGVDVRVVVPKIPDHWYVHTITRSHYGCLIASGVRIYEYTPGFVHAKMFVADDEAAVIGSVNLDYRSLYLHYENAVYLVGDRSVLSIKDDILSMLDQCEEIRYDEWRRRPILTKALEKVMRLFAPLM